MMHKILPGESTLFRIDFAAVSAPKEPWKIHDYEIFPKAVVTGIDLERGLIAFSKQKTDYIDIELINTGTKEASIPHILVGLYDANGLAWINQGYGLESIPAGETRSMAISNNFPPEYSVVIQKTKANDVNADPQYGNYRVISHSFYR